VRSGRAVKGVALLLHIDAADLTDFLSLPHKLAANKRKYRLFSQVAACNSEVKGSNRAAVPADMAVKINTITSAPTLLLTVTALSEECLQLHM